jgi:hypothetical protein
MNHRLTALSAVVACTVLSAGLEARAGQLNQPSSDLPVQPAKQTAAQLQQLVAPISLYPDALVAQILAAATYPDEIVEADRWLQDHSALTSDQLAPQVDAQPWDSSVKALAEYPAILGNMDKNLSWTSTLGDAYANQQQDVMAAVQSMRKLAQQAGNLQSTNQQTVSAQGQTIVIQPTEPDVVYVPEFDPWLAYGGPIGPWPGWYSYPGLFWDGPGVRFALGFNVGFFGGFGWGWHHWNADWHRGAVVYNHNTYISHSRTIVNRRVMAARPHATSRPGPVSHGGEFHGDVHAAPRSGAFGGFTHGGTTRTLGTRGRSSLGSGSHVGAVRGGGGRGR